MYGQLERLAIAHSSNGFRVLCFPCNQFLGQEPWSEPEIKAFVTEKFPKLNAVLFSKVDINGDDTHPVYQFLKGALPGDITWNFGSKFLIGRDGIPAQRFDAKQSWDEIEEGIKLELEKEVSSHNEVDQDVVTPLSEQKSNDSAPDMSPAPDGNHEE